MSDVGMRHAKDEECETGEASWCVCHACHSGQPARSAPPRIDAINVSDSRSSQPLISTRRGVGRFPMLSPSFAAKLSVVFG